MWAGGARPHADVTSVGVPDVTRWLAGVWKGGRTKRESQYCWEAGGTQDDRWVQHEVRGKVKRPKVVSGMDSVGDRCYTGNTVDEVAFCETVVKSAVWVCDAP